MAPEAGCPFGISGNNLEKRGETNQEREETIPGFTEEIPASSSS